MSFSRILRLSALYFLLVFGAGFVFGTIRVLWLVPGVGVRAAELLETPLMLVAMAIAARWIVGRFNVPQAASTRLSIGLVALIFLLVAELGVAARLRGQSATEALLDRDPVSGPVYFISLGVFAVMPLFFARNR